MSDDKQAVQDYWNVASCGEALYLSNIDNVGYEAQAKKRYELEPYIESFAQFAGAYGRAVLEVGVGLGADHERFASSGALLSGVDLTQRAVEHTLHRLTGRGLTSQLQVADAENLPFSNDHFDIVYSWGVLHHSPNTPKAVNEVWRVLRSDGSARIMVYHKYSIVGYMLWLRYALLIGRPWRSLSEVYSHHLESPGTKAYSIDEARKLFARFARVEIKTVLTHGDLLSSDVGQRHRGMILSIARAIWPRWLIRILLPKHGLFLLITAVK